MRKKSKKTAYHTILSARIPRELDDRLEEYVRRSGLKKQRVIEKAIERLLDKKL